MLASTQEACFECPPFLHTLVLPELFALVQLALLPFVRALLEQLVYLACVYEEVGEQEEEKDRLWLCSVLFNRPSP